MALSRDSKEKIVHELIEKLESSKGIILTDYKGMNVSQINKLREELKEQQVEYKVIKNTLIEKAARKLEIDEITKDLTGCTAIAFSSEDGVSPARWLKEYSKKNKLELKVKSGLIDGKFFDPDKIMEIASLPSRDILISKMLAGIKSPINSLVFVLQGTLSGLVYTLEAIKKKKEKEVKIT
ncbi:MAG: 50S ribosomal protein L10 [Candidatus Caldatribacteriota bacterium]|nr:50S ribosomal protein L10 [Candidatus Caldatribacteriota bacterium]